MNFQHYNNVYFILIIIKNLLILVGFDTKTINCANLMSKKV